VIKALPLTMVNVPPSFFFFVAIKKSTARTPPYSLAPRFEIMICQITLPKNADTGKQRECTGHSLVVLKHRNASGFGKNASSISSLPWASLMIVGQRFLKFRAVDAKVAPRAFARSTSNARRSLAWLPAYLLNLQIWVFPKIGVPPNHPF